MQKAEDNLIDYLASDEAFQSAQPYKNFILPYAEFPSPFPSPPKSYAPSESSTLCPSFSSSSLCFSPSTVVPTRLGPLKFTEPPKHIWGTGILNDSQRKSLGVSIRPQYAKPSPMTSIVYDGVAGGNGDLFQEQKFFIPQRIPMRERLVNNVKSNGGLIVKLESHADVLIADHARPKAAPPNSVSWNYIDQSVKNCQLEDLEAHRIGPSVNSSRPVGSGKPTRVTRTPFTQADDNELRIWVTKAEKRGLSTKGNEIYQQLEAINPQHTFQSWRDHWIKHLCHQRRPEVAINSPTGPTRSAKPVKPHIKSTQAGGPSRTAARNIPAVMKRSIPSKVPSSASHIFTPDDIETLEIEFPDISRVQPEDLSDAWESFASHYKRHTAAEWCSYYHNVFKPKKDKEKEQEKAEEEKSKTSKSPFSDDELRFPSSGAVSPPRSEEIIVSKSFPKSQPSEELSGSAVSIEKENFLEDLRNIARITSRQIEPHFDLARRKVQLYDLWNVVNRPEFGGFNNVDKTDRWLQVAVKLNINTYTHATAHTTLRQKYHDILIDLDTFRTIKMGGTVKEKPKYPSNTVKPVQKVTAIADQVPKSSQVFPDVEVNAKTTLPATLPKKKSHSNVAVKRIRRSVGLGELPFLNSLEEFVRDVLKKTVDLEPIVSGREIPLFHLWTLSLPHLEEFDDIKSNDVWQEVASEMGFDPSKHPSAPSELREICDAWLVDYYEYFRDIEKERAKDQGLGSQRESADNFSKDGDDHRTESVLPNLRKRSVQLQSPLAPGQNQNKRPRIDKGKGKAVEIPSTPEHVYNSHLAGQLEENKEFDKPLKRSLFADKLTKQSNKTRPPTEPETQEFHFSSPQLEDINSSRSHQLWSEDINDDSRLSHQNIEGSDAAQSETDSQLANIELEALFERWGAAGYSDEIVVQMLQITTMDAVLAEGLLKGYTKGMKLPRDVPGVWTWDDDECVKSHEGSRNYQHVLAKHGEQRCMERRRFLADLKDAEAEME